MLYVTNDYLSYFYYAKPPDIKKQHVDLNEFKTVFDQTLTIKLRPDGKYALPTI